MKSTLRTIFGILLFCTSCFFIFLEIFPPSTPADNLQESVVERSLESPKETGRDFKYVLNTSTCYVPDFDPFDANMEGYFKKVLSECSPVAKALPFRTKVSSRKTCPLLDLEVLKEDYGGINPEDLICYYTEYVRDEHSPVPDASFKARRKKLFAINSCPPEENIWIECSAPEVKFSQPLLLPKARRGIPVTEMSSDEPFGREQSERAYNVVVLGIDALSRLNFLRQMRKTRQWLEERKFGAIEMFGYNKIGENSAPNQIPMMTGESYLPGLRDRAIGNFFDNLTRYIWDSYAEKGYHTMFFEEQWSTGLFIHPSMNGFEKVPTDYWPRALMQRIEQSGRDGVTCLGGRNAEAVYLQYLTDLLELSRSSAPLFAYAWFSQLSHDTLPGARRCDDDFLEFFENIEKNEILEETIFFFVSDHGSRLEEWRGTTVGRYEDMLPFFYVMLPERFRNERPDDVDRLRRNSRRLITVYDIHATLQELLTITTGRVSIESSGYSADDSGKEESPGLSLLSEEIPESRTCVEAGINLQFCSCLRASDTASMDERFKLKFAKFVINAANKELLRNNVTHLCHEWRMQSIYDVFQLSDPQGEFQVFKMLLIASPHSAYLEASAVYKEGKFELLSQIERLDWYSSNAGCVAGKPYARYCYCK